MTWSQVLRCPFSVFISWILTKLNACPKIFQLKMEMVIELWRCVYVNKSQCTCTKNLSPNQGLQFLYNSHSRMKKVYKAYYGERLTNWCCMHATSHQCTCTQILMYHHNTGFACIMTGFHFQIAICHTVINVHVCRWFTSPCIIIYHSLLTLLSDIFNNNFTFIRLKKVQWLPFTIINLNNLTRK